MDTCLKSVKIKPSGGSNNTDELLIVGKTIENHFDALNRNLDILETLIGYLQFTLNGIRQVTRR